MGTTDHDRRRLRQAHRGFSMIELLICIGILLVLIGLIVPALGAALDHGRNSADLAVLRSHSATLIQWAHDHEDLYPIASDTRCLVGTRWYEPLVREGRFSGIVQADPNSYPRWGTVTFAMSQSLAADPIEFTVGWTRPCQTSPTSPVAQHMVTWPSGKGMMFEGFEREGLGATGGGTGVGTDRTFCCKELWQAPVAFCDGSAEIGDRLDYSPNHAEPVILRPHGVGYPIYAPWGGYRARER